MKAELQGPCVGIDVSKAHWDVAEIELSALGQECLDRRIAQCTTLAREIEHWNTSRNRPKASVNWQFTTADARIKLRRLYPSLQG